MHADNGQARAADDGLQDHEQGIEQEAPEIALRERELAYAARIDLLAQHHHQHKGTDPEGEVHEQRCHGRAVGVDRIKLHGIQTRRRADELRDLLRIEPVFADEVLEHVGTREHHHVGVHAVDLVDQAVQKRLFCRGIVRRIQIALTLADLVLTV